MQVWLVTSQFARTQTVVEVKFVDFMNPTGRLANGACCVSPGVLGQCSSTDQCDNFFIACLDDGYVPFD